MIKTVPAVCKAITAVAGCLGLMVGVRWLDPTSYAGRHFAFAFAVGWCLGLMVWSLAIVRKHSSQFDLRFVLAGMAGVGLFLTALRVFPPYVPVLFSMGAVSLCMLSDAVRTPAIKAEAPGLTQRSMIGLAGAFGAAHVVRVVGVWWL